MNQEVLREWVAALRSGQYAQGRSHLHDATSNRFCCLGVLSDMAVKAGVIPPPVSCPLDDGVVISSFHGGHTEMPPREVYRWLGIPEGAGVGSPDLSYIHLATMNDAGKDFAEIADAIENEWIVKGGAVNA